MFLPIETTQTLSQTAAPYELDELEQHIMRDRPLGKTTCVMRPNDRSGYVYVKIHSRNAQRKQASELHRVHRETMVRVAAKVRAERA